MRSFHLPGIHIEQKKGDEHRLAGKLIAYVRWLGKDLGQKRGDDSSPIVGMVRNGILAVQGNYIGQRNIRDFFREEFGISLEKGIQEVIEQARDTGGLEGALDPEAVKERLESMKNADFIPIPAKVAFFESEVEILASAADVYYLGTFEVLSHAHLCVNSFPILYQACFREQEHREVAEEINALLGNIEGDFGENAEGGADGKTDPERGKAGGSSATLKTYTGDAKDFLLRDLIPGMIYSLGDKVEYKGAVDKFKAFMGDFAYPDDMQAILTLIESTPKHDSAVLRKLELLVAKIEALQREDFEALERIRRDLKQLDGN
jgi:hypothetical protein